MKKLINDPANVVLLGNLLGVVLADLCSRKKLAANLVASGHIGQHGNCPAPARADQLCYFLAHLNLGVS